MSDSLALQGSRRRPGRQPAWATLPDENLLQLRLKDLDLSVHGTWLQACLQSLNAEIAKRGLLIQAHAWISDEWFSPDNSPGIAVPFYLAHPRLVRLERRMVLDVEGGTRPECMQIMRHEAGHVVQHAYGLHRRRRWQELFGRSSTRYPDYYRPNPASKHYVQHLRRWYAQSHPDEDFAETFAVWLTPRSSWRTRYADWPALEKLEYVDDLMTELVGKKPTMTKRLEVDPISKLPMTLGEHYRKKVEHYAVDAQTTYDKDLQKLFSSDVRHRSAPTAASFLRKNRAAIRTLVSKSTGEYLLTLDGVLDELIERARALKLRAPGSERQLRMNLTAMLTTKTAQSRYSSSRRQWFAL